MEWRVRHCRPSVDTVSVIINVMVSVLASSVVDREFDAVKTKTLKLIFSASSLIV